MRAASWVQIASIGVEDADGGYGLRGHERRLTVAWGAIVSPRSSISTSSAIFLARPAAVFMLFVRKARRKRF
jgi:hypothetical protein